MARNLSTNAIGQLRVDKVNDEFAPVWNDLELTLSWIQSSSSRCSMYVLSPARGKVRISHFLDSYWNIYTRLLRVDDRRFDCRGA